MPGMGDRDADSFHVGVAGGKINEAERILGYKFARRDLIWEALQAPGSPVWIINGRRLHKGHLELAVVGDAAMKLVFCWEYYLQGLAKGQMSQQAQKHECNSNLAKLGAKAGLGSCINQDPSRRGQISESLMADTVEACIGAVWADKKCNSDAVRVVLQRLGVLRDPAGQDFDTEFGLDRTLQGS